MTAETTDAVVVLRFCEPTTPYFNRAFLHPDAVYLADERFVCIVVKQWEEHRNGVLGDCTWLFPEEVRLLASLALSVPEGRGTLRFAPHWRQFSVPLGHDVDLASDKSISLLSAFASEHVSECFSEHTVYELTDHAGFEEDFPHEVFDCIDPSDELLIRGLYTLLKSQHILNCHLYALMEEAITSVQISREAALELIREVLVSEGNNNASFRDAHEYLRREFRAGEPLAEYFEDLHEVWVATKHPQCAAGPFWNPPLIADDFYETYEALVSVYRHVLTGEPGRKTADIGRQPSGDPVDVQA